MNQLLRLQKNSDIVNQYSKIIVNAVLSKISERNKQEIGIFDDELSVLNIPGIRYLTTRKMIVSDYGWLVSEYTFDMFIWLGKSLQGILNARSNNKNGDRSTYVSCPSAVKGQKLLVIQIYLKDTYKENFLVINQKGKIVKSRFGAMYSHNWDKDSAEELAPIEHPVYDDFEYEYEIE